MPGTLYAGFGDGCSGQLICKHHHNQIMTASENTDNELVARHCLASGDTLHLVTSVASAATAHTRPNTCKHQGSRTFWNNRGGE